MIPPITKKTVPVNTDTADYLIMQKIKQHIEMWLFIYNHTSLTHSILKTYNKRTVITMPSSPAYAPFLRYQGFMFAFMFPMLLNQPTLTFAGLLLLLNLALYAIVTHDTVSGTSQSRLVAIVSSPTMSLTLAKSIGYHVVTDALRMIIPVSVVFYFIATAIWQYLQGASTLSLSLPIFMTALKLIVITAYLLAWIPALLRFSNNDKEAVCE